jgi:hypothetical protein
MLDPVTAASLVTTTLWVINFKGINTFFHNLGFMGIKRGKILLAFFSL